MRSKLAFVVAFAFAAASLGLPALAQKQGGTLRVYHRDNLPSASIHEEATISTVQPFMGIFNNLVLFDQQKPLNSADTIVPDLAESWAWDDSKTKLTFKLRQGVKWHDGKPFTAADVKCTWDLHGRPQRFHRALSPVHRARVGLLARRVLVGSYPSSPLFART